MNVDQLTSARLFGRLNTLVILILRKQGVTDETLSNKTLFDNYFDALYYASEKEASILRSLMDKYNERKQNERYNSNSSEQQRIGADEATYTYEKNKDVSALLLDKDLIKRKKLRKQWSKKDVINFLSANKEKVGLIACVIVALFILTYNLPYFQDKRFFKEVQEVQTVYICNEYIKKFPKGRYIDDVMYIQVDLTKSMESIMTYLKRFPKGQYSDTVNYICDSLWNIEINKYHDRDKSGHSQEAVTYMTNMLEYMKKKRVTIVNLRISPHISLKDYSEYDENIRQFIERDDPHIDNDQHLTKKDDTDRLIDSLLERRSRLGLDKINSSSRMDSLLVKYKKSRQLIAPTRAVTIKNDMLPLKTNFKVQETNILTKILADGLQEGFNRILTPNFIQVTSSQSVNSPTVSIDYYISNQEYFGIPAIWQYEKGGVLTNYLLGISINFEANFSVPDELVKYTYNEVGNPSGEISNIKDIQDGYKQMSQMCFAQFSNTITDQLGLEQMYFQGEE